MGKRVRISNSTLNSYGTRVLTSGMSIEQFKKNPVLLYMHSRGRVIGYIDDIKVEGDDVTGVPVFDEATELSKETKKQFEFGSIRAVSAGLDVIETSDAPELILPGQRYATITKCSLYEVSIVDIGANSDALVLRHNGQELKLSKDGDINLPKLNLNKKNDMEMEQLALALGLDKGADSTVILNRAEELVKTEGKYTELSKQAKAARTAMIEAMVAKAIEEEKITAANRERYIELGNKTSAKELSQILADMQPRTKLSELAKPETAKTSNLCNLSWDELDKQGKLSQLKAEHPEVYKQKYAEMAAGVTIENY